MGFHWYKIIGTHLCNSIPYALCWTYNSILSIGIHANITCLRQLTGNNRTHDTHHQMIPLTDVLICSSPVTLSPWKSTLCSGVHETCEGQGPHGGVLQSITDTMEMFYDVAAAATAAPTPRASNTAAWSVAPRFKVWWCSDNRVIFSPDIGVCILYVNYYYLYICII